MDHLRQSHMKTVVVESRSHDANSGAGRIDVYHGFAICLVGLERNNLLLVKTLIWTCLMNNWTV